MSDPSLYDQDFYAWANEQAALLRAGKLSAADIEHIAEEIESMGKTEKREMVSRLTVLLLHLLKWQYQQILRGSSGQTTIIVQRLQLADHLDDNPSLRAKTGEIVPRAYRLALAEAAAETTLPRSTFPAECPWSFDQIMDADFWPGEVSH
jgi:Domain of unknown function DUF29